MKKMIISAVLIFTSLSAFAYNNKVGTVILNGEIQNIVIQEQDAWGTINIGNEVFKVTSAGIRGVEGQALSTVNGKTTKDLSIFIHFRVFSENALQGLVDNKSEINCESQQANSTIIMSNNLTNSVVGNCATLKDK